MKVDLVTTYSGKRLHIASDMFTLFTLCGARPERIVWRNYELTEAEPNVAGVAGLCKVCRKAAVAREEEDD